MARLNDSISDSVINVLIKMPPRLCIAFGVVAYAGMEWYQRSHVVPQGDMLLSLATSVYPPLVLAFFVFMAACGAVHRVRRERLVDQQTGLDSLRHIPWKDFEYLVAEAFRRQGYAVEYSLDHGPDGGVDIELKKNGRVSLVQCKQWKNGSVGVAVVREMFGILHARHADEVFIATTGGFTADAAAFAKGKPIILMDGAALWKMVSDVQAEIESTPDAPKPIATPTGKRSRETAPAATAPECPRCGGEMVRRVSGKGYTPGRPFWGCTRYPSCQGTASIHGEAESNART